MRLILLALLACYPVLAQPCGRMAVNPITGKMDCIGIPGAGGAPSGAAGGGLGGTYPNPTLVDGSTLTKGSTVVAQKFFVTAPPGSISGNLPGDFATDTTNHLEYVCNAPSGTAAPACTSVTAAGWMSVNAGGSAPAGSAGAVQNYATSSTLGDSGCTATSGVMTCVGFSGTASGPAQLLIPVANAGVTGTTQYKLAKINSSGAAVIIATTDTTIPVYPVAPSSITNCSTGTTGNACFVQAGQATLTFDGAAVIGDYAIASTTIAGDVHDVGATLPSTTGSIFQVMTTVSGAGVTGTVQLVYGALTGPAGAVNSVSGTSPVVSSGGATPVISLSANGITSSLIAAVNNRRTCTIDNDSQSATALTAGNFSGGCEIPFAATIVEVDVFGGTGIVGGTVTTTGTGSVNIQKYTPNGGATTTLLSGALATASGYACALTATSGTCINGTTSSGTITVSTTSLAAGDWMRVSAATPDTVQTWYRVAIVYTVN